MNDSLKELTKARSSFQHSASQSAYAAVRPCDGRIRFSPLERILESIGTAAHGRRTIPGLHNCEQNHRAFLPSPAEAIRDRLLFVSHLLGHFAVRAGAMAASDAKELERRMEAVLQDVASRID